MSEAIGYFQIDEEEMFFAMILKSFWDENGSLDSEGSEEDFIPEGFFAVSEGIYEHTYDSNEDAIKVLNAANWVAKDLNM